MTLRCLSPMTGCGASARGILLVRRLLTIRPSPVLGGSENLKGTQSRLVRESVWVVGGRILGIATAIGVNILLARVLPPSGRTSVCSSLLASIVTFFGFVAMFGLNTGLVRFVSESIGLKNKAKARSARSSRERSSGRLRSRLGRCYASPCSGVSESGCLSCNKSHCWLRW